MKIIDPDKTTITFTDSTWGFILSALRASSHKSMGIDAANTIQSRINCETIHCDECQKVLDEEEALLCFQVDAEACFCSEHS